MNGRAYAKVNIGLAVGEKRPDGYHNIDTYMALIGLCDDISMEIAPSDSFSCTIRRDRDYLSGGTDLMEKAAAAFCRISGRPLSVGISIRKRIPSGAGLGGGSSDAACVLRMLASSSGAPQEMVMEAASMTGSDVMFFASGYSAAHVSGRGEIISPIAIPGGLSVELAVPHAGVCTSAAYSAIDGICRKHSNLPALLFDPVPDERIFTNDFAIICGSPCPQYHSEGPSYVSLSGSGAAWYAIHRQNDVFEFDKSEKYDIFSTSFIISE